MLKPEKKFEKEREKGYSHEFPRQEYSNDFSQNGTIRLKVRLDYKGHPRPNRFFFGGKKTEEVAEEVREQRATLWKNVPLQGVRIEEVQPYDIYKVIEGEEEEEEIAYAPLELVLSANSLEDCICVLAREEFRTLEILEPSSLTFTAQEIEKLFYRFSEAFRSSKKL